MLGGVIGLCPVLVTSANAQSSPATTSGSAAEPAISSKADLQTYITANIKTFLAAAKRGDADAQFRLGIAYSMGWGVQQDYVNAFKWFSLAGAQGNDQAKKYLQAMESLMTADQITSGQKLSKDFKPVSEAPGSAEPSVKNP